MKVYKNLYFCTKTNSELSKLIFAHNRISYLVDKIILFYFTMKKIVTPILIKFTG